MCIPTYPIYQYHMCCVRDCQKTTYKLTVWMWAGNIIMKLGTYLKCQNIKMEKSQKSILTKKLRSFGFFSKSIYKKKFIFYMYRNLIYNYDIRIRQTKVYGDVILSDVCPDGGFQGTWLILSIYTLFQFL